MILRWAVGSLVIRKSQVKGMTSGGIDYISASPEGAIREHDRFIALAAPSELRDNQFLGEEWDPCTLYSFILGPKSVEMLRTHPSRTEIRELEAPRKRARRR